jgi:hypothetical protein
MLVPANDLGNITKKCTEHYDAEIVSISFIVGDI